MDEEEIAAKALGDILTSTLWHAYETAPVPRTWLFCWERDGLQWLLRFRERRPGGSTGNLWISTFLDLNREAILDPDGAMNFNLRDAA